MYSVVNGGVTRFDEMCLIWAECNLLSLEGLGVECIGSEMTCNMRLIGERISKNVSPIP